MSRGVTQSGLCWDFITTLILLRNWRTVSYGAEASRMLLAVIQVKDGDRPGGSKGVRGVSGIVSKLEWMGFPVRWEKMGGLGYVMGKPQAGCASATGVKVHGESSQAWRTSAEREGNRRGPQADWRGGGMLVSPSTPVNSGLATSFCGFSQLWRVLPGYSGFDTFFHVTICTSLEGNSVIKFVFLLIWCSLHSPLWHFSTIPVLTHCVSKWYPGSKDWQDERP